MLTNNEINCTVNRTKTLTHYPGATREWNNSIYAYNKNALNLIPNTTLSSINIIKSYFLLYNYKLEKKIRTRRLIFKYKRLSSNKIFISNGEFKHTNNKVIVNLYLFNRQKYNYLLALKKIYLRSIFNLKKNKYKPQIKNRFNSVKMKNNFITKRYKYKNIKIWKYKLKTNKLKKVSVNPSKISKYTLVKPKSIKKKITNILDPKLKSYSYNLINTLPCIYNSDQLGNYSYNSVNMFPRTYNLYYQIVEGLGNIKFKRNKIEYLLTIVYRKKKIKHGFFNKSFLKKIRAKRKKGLLLLKLINNDKFLIIKNLNHNKKISLFISTYISKFYKKFIKRSLIRLKRYFYYRQLLFINKSKYNYNYLQYLNKYLYPLYNKNIEYNLINLKRFYLHSDILSESMKLKLTRNKRRMLKKLKRLKMKIGVKDKNTFLRNEILKKRSTITANFLKKKDIINKLKYKDITGFRLETTGRLTRRYTASRSVSKNVYKGNLLDLRSSYRGLPNILLKGNLESNLQYTKLKSKSRIGSFGIKGWISGN